MKIRVTMKDPDVLYDSVRDAVDGWEPEGLTDEELELVREERERAIKEVCSKWFEYDEYLTVEIDTKAGTCVVVEKGK